MTEEIRSIIDKARLLSDAIREHEISRRYEECRSRMRNDRTASELYAKLVAFGNELNAKIARGETIESGASSESELLKQELDGNSLVKEYILGQKEYLDMMTQVIERIKNPAR